MKKIARREFLEKAVEEALPVALGIASAGLAGKLLRELMTPGIAEASSYVPRTFYFLYLDVASQSVVSTQPFCVQSARFSIRITPHTFGLFSSSFTNCPPQLQPYPQPFYQQPPVPQPTRRIYDAEAYAEGVFANMLRRSGILFAPGGHFYDRTTKIQLSHPVDFVTIVKWPHLNFEKFYAFDFVDPELHPDRGKMVHDNELFLHQPERTRDVLYVGSRVHSYEDPASLADYVAKLVQVIRTPPIPLPKPDILY